jgi:HEAT repeat protein
MMTGVSSLAYPIILAHVFLLVPVCYSQVEPHEHIEDKFDVLVVQSRSRDAKERGKALIAMLQTNDVRAVEYLIRALRDENSGVQNVAAGAIRRMGALALKPLIALLEEDDVQIRFKAANLLAQTKDPLAIERLNAALADDDLVIVAGAYTYFMKIGQKAAEEALIQSLHPYSTEAMIRDFLSSGNPRLREAACAQAAMHGDEQLCDDRADVQLGKGR